MIRALLEHHRPSSLVAWDADRSTTAAELVAHVAGFAGLLPEAEPGEEVVVICRDRHRFTVALLAAWQRGFSVALPPNPQPDTMRAMRERAGVRTVVHDVDGGLGIDVRDASVREAARAQVGRHPFAPLAPFAPERLLATVYTSGSTGEHTACPKTASQLVGEASVLAETFSFGEGARVLAMVPPYHIYGLLFGVLVPLVGGAALYRHTPLLAPEVAAVLASGVDVLVTVPAQLRALALAPETQPKLSRVFSSGAPLSPRVARRVKERFGWTVTEVFGSSETGGIWLARERRRGAVDAAAGRHGARGRRRGAAAALAFSASRRAPALRGRRPGGGGPRRQLHAPRAGRRCSQDRRREGGAGGGGAAPARD